MKTVALKCGIGGCVSLAHPQAKPGWTATARIFRVVDVPDDVKLDAVMRLANLTVMYPDGDAYAFSDLGLGKIARPTTA